MEIEVEIYWDDLSDARQQELLDAGYDNGNVTNGVFPITTIYVGDED